MRKRKLWQLAARWRDSGRQQVLVGREQVLDNFRRAAPGHSCRSTSTVPRRSTRRPALRSCLSPPSRSTLAASFPARPPEVTSKQASNSWNECVSCDHSLTPAASTMLRGLSLCRAPSSQPDHEHDAAHAQPAACGVDSGRATAAGVAAGVAAGRAGRAGRAVRAGRAGRAGAVGRARRRRGVVRPRGSIDSGCCCAAS
jgi:hypothetical protein